MKITIVFPVSSIDTFATVFFPTCMEKYSSTVGAFGQYEIKEGIDKLNNDSPVVVRSAYAANLPALFVRAMREKYGEKNVKVEF